MKWIERHQDKLMIALYLIFILFIGTSCRIKKDITKSSEVINTEVRATETATSVTKTTGTIVTEKDSICNYAPIEGLLNGDTTKAEDKDFITTLHFDKKTKTVKSKTVQKPKEVPVSITNTTTSRKHTEEKSSQEKKTTEKHKETDSPFLDKIGQVLFWLIILLIIFGFWRLWKFIN